MHRIEFEARVNAAIGAVVARYDLTLTTRLPSSVYEDEPVAIFETTVQSFQRSLPTLAALFDLDARCVELNIRWSADGVLAVDLEGVGLDELARRANLPVEPRQGSLDEQLEAAAGLLAQTLRASARRRRDPPHPPPGARGVPPTRSRGD